MKASGRIIFDGMVAARGQMDGEDLVRIIGEANDQLRIIIMNRYRQLREKGQAGQRTKSP